MKDEKAFYQILLKQEWKFLTESDQVLRVLKQLLDQVDEDPFRLEPRGEDGRFIILSVGADMSIACVTDQNPNVPLLEIAFGREVRLQAQ